MAWSTSISWDGSQNMDSYCTNQPVQWNLIGVFLMINLWKLGEIYGSQVAEHVSEKKHVMWRRSYGYDPQAGFYNSHATSNLLMGHPMFMRCIANEGRLARESYHKRPVSGFSASICPECSGSWPVPSGKLSHNYGKSPLLIGKSTKLNGPCSIANC